jgi:hypothetical protein
MQWQRKGRKVKTIRDHRTNLIWQGGTLTGGGSVTVSAKGILEINANIVVPDGETLTNQGTATWTSGSIEMDDGAGFHNASRSAVKNDCFS